ncbi:MAG TPA: hypothetical protein VKS60_19665 [Stellaceae bacterium]|nr:hypothetical protein [Stellaceae bacterium]
MIRIQFLLGGGAALLLLASGADAARVAPETAATGVVVTNPASKPVPTQDVDSPLRNVYLETKVTGTCSQNPCYVVFTALTAPVTLVRNVTCMYSQSSGGTVNDFYFVAGNAVITLPIFSLPPFSGGNTYYGSNLPTYMPMTSGTTPYIALDYTSTAPMNFECTLSGSTAN